ncbi:hypothetical protein [Dokdonella soli]|uniref:Uncharacterized protein n=1 Tax=Dokdonella soli TaxID=529810 RepID=A0ABN1IE71_9GAMM
MPHERKGRSTLEDASEARARTGSPAVVLDKEADVQHVVSLFRRGSWDRQLLDGARREAQIAEQGAVDYDQKPWSLLYQALINSLGASPQTFQMVYPFTAWNWPTQQVGFIGAAQYDFCSSSPQWSAVGMYASGGDRFNQAYQEFLNVIVAATDDPALRARIREADDALTAATNDYTIVYNQARSAYADDPDVQDNVPPFSKWLGTPAGKGWQTQITRAEVKMTQAQKNYDALVDQAQTPGLADAQNQFKNTEFYSKLNDPGLSTFPKVPNWSTSQNAATWVDRVKAGQGPAGGTMGFTNRDASYDYSNTWAGGSLAVRQFFWEVQVSGSWQRMTEFETDQQLEVSIEFDALDQIQIQGSDWYNGSFLRSKANGPFKRGYSAYGGDGTQAVFGKKGFVGLLKTGMYVGYKPTFTIKTSKSTFNRFLEQFKAATALRIGPFTFSAEGGSEKSGWNASEQGQTFTGTSTSDTPLIIGLSISELPNGSDEQKTLTAQEPRGRCYKFGGHEGDVLAEGVTEEACAALGGESWKPAKAIAAITPLRNLRVNQEGAPFTEVLQGPDAEMQLLNGVQHVSVFPPFNLLNGGPDHVHLYRIRAINALTGQPVDLHLMRFGGIAPHTGAARFADQ